MTIMKLTSLAAAALVLATSFAQAGGGGIQINQTVGNAQINQDILKLAKVAVCEVAGTPSEFPDDIWLVNKGAGKLVAGTKIKWSVEGYSNYKGTYTLVAQLSPGQGVKLNGVLGGGVEAGHPCAAKAL